MIYDIAIREKIEISDEEKQKSIKLLFIILSIGKKAHLEGLLSIENDIKHIEDEFLKHGLQLVVNGTDPDDIQEILSNHVTFCKHTGKRLLEMLIIVSGVLSIQGGETLELLSLKMASYLGDMGLNLVNNCIFRNAHIYDHQGINSLDSGLTVQIIMHLNGMKDKTIQKIIKNLGASSQVSVFGEVAA